MPTLQSPGLGSGLDINTLVERLVAAERAPQAARLTRQESRLTTQISALGTLRGALSAFKAALEPLRTETAFAPRRATSGDESLFTVSAGAAAAPGRYDVEVVALASAHRLASGPFAGGPTAAVGTGTLTITVAGDAFDVVVDATNDSLAGIRDAINQASDNTGVQATIINEVAGSRLLLTSTRTGAEESIRVVASGGDGGLTSLVYDPPGTAALTELQAAADAQIRIAGFDHFSATNTISGAIDGVTLTLQASRPGSTVSLDVVHDDATVLERVKKLVTEYNSLQTQTAKLRSYSPQTRLAGPLLGDALLRAIEDEIRRALSDPVPGLEGDYQSLASIGVTKLANGSLALDESKLTTALATDRRAVAALLGSADGVASRLYERLDARLAAESALDVRSQRLQKGIQDVEREREMLDVRMKALEARYRRQFTALDALLANLQTTSSYLAQQLARVPKAGDG